MVNWFFHDLDQDIRRRMAEEFEQNGEASTVFVSPAIDPSRVDDYLEAQRAALLYGSPETLETALLEAGLLPSFRDDRDDADRGVSARDLAGDQYAVYYVRAVAQRAIELGDEIEIYRALGSGPGLDAADARVGQTLDARTLLEDLRDNSVHPDNFSQLPEIRSGLIVRLL